MSAYTLFFFKSASGLTSILFLIVMLGLLVANELPRFRQLGPVVRLGLFGPPTRGAIAVTELDRVATVVRLHLQLGLDVPAIELLLAGQRAP